MTDFFKTKKLVHVKLDKDTHFNLKTLLLKNNITMQEFIAEFCIQYVNGSGLASKIIENYIVRKNKYKIQELAKNAENLERAKRVKDLYEEIDKDVIYDILDQESPLNDKDEEEDIDV